MGFMFFMIFIFLIIAFFYFSRIFIGRILDNLTEKFQQKFNFSYEISKGLVGFGLIFTVFIVGTIFIWIFGL